MCTLVYAADSFLAQYFKACEGMDPAARGKYLEDPPEGAPNIESAHQVRGRLGGVWGKGKRRCLLQADSTRRILQRDS